MLKNTIVPNGEVKKASVIKHSATIHISDKITLLQRRTWNVLLAHCYDELGDKEIHKIKMTLLWDYLGGTVNRPDTYIKNLVEELAGIRVKWNILDKDKETEVEWGVSSLLASCVIKNGVCAYAFSPHLREKLYNPSMYAKISLSLQNKFDSKHALALYELALDYYIVKKKFGETPQIPLEVFKELMGFGAEEYQEYKELKRRVIKPSIVEINAKADIFIELKEFKEARKISALKFCIKENPAKRQLRIGNREQSQLFSDSDTGDIEEIGLIKKSFIEWGVSEENFQKYLSRYELERLQDVKTEVEKTKYIKNRPAWIFKALEENYDLPEAQKEREKQGKIKKDLEIKKRKQEKEELAKEQEKIKQQQIDIWVSENSMKYNWICLEFLEEAPKDSKIKFSYDYWTKNAKKESKDLLEYCKKNKTFLGFVRNKIYTDNIVDMNI